MRGVLLAHPGQTASAFPGASLPKIPAGLLATAAMMAACVAAGGLVLWALSAAFAG